MFVPRTTTYWSVSFVYCIIDASTPYGCELAYSAVYCWKLAGSKRSSRKRERIDSSKRACFFGKGPFSSTASSAESSLRFMSH